MKKILLFVVTVHLASTITAQKPGALIDVQHYEFSIHLTDSNDVIKGKAAIDVLFIKDTKTITLDLISKSDSPKGMTVLQVTDNGKPLVYTHTNDLLTIEFDTSINRGEHKNIEIIYEGIPADGLIFSKNKYGHRVFFADNWPNRRR